MTSIQERKFPEFRSVAEFVLVLPSMYVHTCHERTWKAKPKQTPQLNETRETSVLVLTSQYVTTRPSLLARFCTPPEVKFHIFRRLKHGGEKSILKKIFDTIKQRR